MSIFDIWKSKKPKPIDRVELDKLGSVVWSDDDESWQGLVDGISFFIGIDDSSDRPIQPLIDYTESALLNDWLRDAVNAAKDKYAADHPQFADELADLSIESVHVYLRKGSRHLNCHLGYGASDRFWALDFIDYRCTGMGFDT
ncbi:hypothetical protein H0E84_13760 [Luteimonas sp. SJ-92]|uniref:DUF2262 domain-containing protein n=1 Tax=Luteimonas salinisoli TaxID=2752307 RepID=A0A853JDQ5_9GAMM|nr:hypothetical protein [Luteimonas salinisoli]NZA27451.1 hypothetical protein [Luteimonas salinisoli]